MDRRKFIISSALASTALAIPTPFVFADSRAKRAFKISLNPGMIGVQSNFAQTLDYAISFGYEAISPFTQEVMDHYSEQQLHDVTEKMQENKISYCSNTIPLEFRQDDAKFKEGFQGLKKFCKTMEKQGATRMNTWIISSHSELTYNENMRQHAYRLGECAKVMQDHGIRLGLEYLGMRTMLIGNRYPFISSMKEAKELIGEIGQDNVGLVLDSFHWYCANESIEDIQALHPNEIIVVDLNDAREGFTRQTQVDGKRELPAATGVIPVHDFLKGLIDIGYDGPLRSEPFNQVLNDMENEAALKANMDAVQAALAL
ncbi:sugar phosphate isomerase/epimerase family protein [Cecembia sp.]|uniref:sugar phosphate isomerase/epimerase family protein n=1 Tax=Cecembia sp. TaxID=1898110 RepID=UPI0025C608D7|nr:sugar phosphate isomerase/epimerase family protein [Cecembia sp.]